MSDRDWGHASDLDDVSGQVAIVGIGETEYTKASGRTAREIGAQAVARAIADAGLEPTDVDGLTYSGAFADFDEHAFHEHFGTDHELWVSKRGGGMTGAATAPYLAAKAIERGQATAVVNVHPVAWATQRSSMTGGPGEMHAALSAKQNLEVPFGFFPQPVYFAAMMRRHMIEFGTTAEQFGEVAVACRANANRNPGAVMHDRTMTIDDYLASPMLADPLRMFDSCLISDGGAAFVTTSTERARDLPHVPLLVTGVSEATSRTGSNWAQQPAFTSTPHVFESHLAFEMAGIQPDDVDVLACYDPFTVASMMQIEDMGFCPKGEAGRFVEGGTLRHDGALPYNTHGGLLSHTYVLGIAHVIEIAKQLRRVAGAQVTDCEVAVYGGYTGPQTSTLVLTRQR